MDIGTLLNGGPEGVWHPIPGAEGARVKIRNVRPKRRRELVLACTKKYMRRSQVVAEIDDLRLSDMLLQECVIEWEGIEHGGEPFPVTPENKRLLDDNWPEFSNLWNAVIGDVNAIDEQMAEAELGNLPTGQTSS